MEENNLSAQGGSASGGENKDLNVGTPVPNNNNQQIAAAIIIAGLVIAGAILIKGNGLSTGGTPTTAARKLNPSTAKVIGLDTKAFNTCLASGKFADKIQADIDDGAGAGVNGTPSSFILKDGKVVASIGGAQPFEQVMQQIGDAKASTAKILDIKMKPISADDHILGNIGAKIVILEYSDLECPYCKVFHKTMHQVIESNPDIAWVYRHYPIPQLHPKAFHEAEASECAWEQGGNDAYWKYMDKIFEITPSNNGLDVKEL